MLGFLAATIVSVECVVGKLVKRRKRTPAHDQSWFAAE
jgi:hypothetical protein